MFLISSEKGELHVSVSHQFPEDPDSLGKEIRKYEQLLEQTHTQMKSSKKVSKKQEAKQEEQLWELQRTLTALKVIHINMHISRAILISSSLI